jgi:hypothetical protein
VRFYAMPAPSNAEAEAETPFSYSDHVRWKSILKKSKYLCVRQMDRPGKINLWLARHRVRLTALSVEDSRALAYMYDLPLFNL